MLDKRIRNGLVSTIIPVYNRATMLVEAVQSVLDQDYRPIEIIIIDDGSTDETADIARELAEKHQFVTTIQIENIGPGLARETGRQFAHGEFIQYLDSDDLLITSKFSKQVNVLKSNPQYGACYCKTSVLVTSTLQTIENWKRTSETIPNIIPSMLASRWWGTSTPLYRRSITDQAGPWTNLINEEDWEYDCRVGFINGALGYVPEVLSLQRQHDEARLSSDGGTDPKKLTSRAHARHAIIELAIEDQRALDSQEFFTLLIFTFLLARQCGAAGLGEESRKLVRLIKPHLSKHRKYASLLNIYQVGSSLIGWRNMGRLSCYLDNVRA